MKNSIEILIPSSTTILGATIVFILYIIIYDKYFSRHTLLRNYPLIGRGRWFFEYIGRFLYQYIVSNEREESPFSKHDRVQSYKLAKNNNRTEAFGSTKSETNNDFKFIHSQYPHETTNHIPNSITFGEDTENPYTTNSRFNVSAMAFGAISKNAVLALSKGMKLAGGYLNTGEGGISKYHIEGGADLIFQIGTAKYNISNNDKTLNIEKLKNIANNKQVKMFEIKLSQGAKPAKGGILPASKVNDEVARARGIELGKASISPNKHVDINNNDELTDFINKVKINSKKPTGIKLCFGSEDQIETLINHFSKVYIEKGISYVPNFITLDGGEGGTGASPTAFLDDMGMNIKESLPVLVEKLTHYKLKDKIKVIASGKLISPTKIAWAFSMGADSVNSARGFLFSLGCIQSRVCNRNKCPTGIASNKGRYINGLDPEKKSIRVFNYHANINKDTMEIANACGVSSYDELKLKHIREISHIKIKEI